MDRFHNTRIEKQTIYEIFRACRLCGAGGGYKMPIIQNVVDLDDSDAELRQKIRECVQIEVHQDDKMPPLICELCVDKVNDFYEFLEMCRQTNKRTRLRLGLPPQTLPRGVADAGECILGVTEPVYVNNDSKIKSKAFKGGSKGGFKKEHRHVTKADMETISQHGRGPAPKLRRARRTPSPEVPATRSSRTRNDDVALARLVKGDNKSQRPSRVTPKKQIKEEPVVRSKRQHEPDTPKSAMPSKRVKMTPKAAPVKTPSKPEAVCKICNHEFKNTQALGKHMSVHTVRYTSVELACNTCGDWWTSAELAAAHHRRHKPYRCRHCHARYTTHQAYNEHFARKPCSPWAGAPDAVCARCLRAFPTAPLRDRHRCPGEQARPGGKCSKCSRTYSLLRNLQKHESACTAGRKRGQRHRLEARMKPLRVVLARCDALLGRRRGDHCDVAGVPHNYGLDPNTVYPYLTSVRIKSESSINMCDGMVQIKGDLDDLDLDYVHWDSSSESETESVSLMAGPERNRSIPSLSVLSLKTLFSARCLGKVRRKRRKIKNEKELMFDSLLNTTEIDNTITRDINNIIDNLGDDDENVNTTNNDLFNDTGDTDSWDNGNNKNDTLVDIDKIFDSLKDDSEITDEMKTKETDNSETDSKKQNVTPEQSKETMFEDNETNDSEKNSDEKVTESSKNDNMNEGKITEQISNDDSKAVVENEHVSQTKPDDEPKMDEQKTDESNVDNGQDKKNLDDTRTDNGTEDRGCEESANDIKSSNQKAEDGESMDTSEPQNDRCSGSVDKSSIVSENDTKPMKEDDKGVESMDTSEAQLDDKLSGNIDTELNAIIPNVIDSEIDLDSKSKEEQAISVSLESNKFVDSKNEESTCKDNLVNIRERIDLSPCKQNIKDDRRDEFNSSDNKTEFNETIDKDSEIRKEESNYINSENAKSDEKDSTINAETSKETNIDEQTSNAETLTENKEELEVSTGLAEDYQQSDSNEEKIQSENNISGKESENANIVEPIGAVETERKRSAESDAENEAEMIESSVEESLNTDKLAEFSQIYGPEDICDKITNEEVTPTESDKTTNLNGRTETGGFNSLSDQLDDISDTEMEDRRLMEAIDAQLGEGGHKKQMHMDASDVESSGIEKMQSEDLAPDVTPKDSALSSMDLDNISDDEFNFDA